ncbi:MAG: hypothetical protein PWP45_1553 [Tepidanaerobacteraceae bacterium]|nr:hypothetical protein [Tepidanaerobacteraceae bacterium]
MKMKIYTHISVNYAKNGVFTKFIELKMYNY